MVAAAAIVAPVGASEAIGDCTLFAKLVGGKLARVVLRETGG